MRTPKLSTCRWEDGKHYLYRNNQMAEMFEVPAWEADLIEREQDRFRLEALLFMEQALGLEPGFSRTARRSLVATYAVLTVLFGRWALEPRSSRRGRLVYDPIDG